MIRPRKYLTVVAISLVKQQDEHVKCYAMRNEQSTPRHDSLVADTATLALYHSFPRRVNNPTLAGSSAPISVWQYM